MARSKVLDSVTALLMVAISAFVTTGVGLALETVKSADKVSGEPVQGQVISIATAKSAYDFGERIILSVRLKNVGREDVPVFTGPGFPVDYELTLLLVESPHIQAVDKHLRPVLSPTGEVPLTLQGRLVFDSPRGGGGFSGVLRPGDERCVEIDLTRLFDMSLTGRYRVTAQRYVWGRRAIEAREKAISNTVEIAVKDEPYFERACRRRN